MRTRMVLLESQMKELSALCHRVESLLSLYQERLAALETTKVRRKDDSRRAIL